MNNRLSLIWKYVSHYKYLIVIVFGVALVGFVDENSMMKLIQYRLHVSELKAEIEKYNKQHVSDSKSLKELRRNPKAIEKIARERYFMKADNEDIYVLSSDEQPFEDQDETIE